MSPLDSPTFVPLAYGQRAILLAQSVSEPGSLNQHVALCLDPPPVDEQQVTALLAQLQRRHGALAAAFTTRRGRVGINFTPALEDAEPIPLVVEPASLAELLNEPFVRGRSPMARAVLADAARGELHLAIDHLVFDGWSIGVLVKDIRSAWDAIVEGTPPQQPPAAQLRDYQLEQHRAMSAGAVDEYRRFWRDEIEHDATLTIPPGTSRSWKGVTFSVPHDVAADLPAFRRQLRTTDFCIFLSALAVALVGQTGQRSLLIYTIVADRDRDSSSAVGCLLDFVGVRIDIGATFTETVLSARSGLLRALQHHSGPFLEIATPIGGDLGAAVFAQPHLYAEDVWGKRAVEHGIGPVRRRTPWPIGDISFSYKQSGVTYECDLCIRDSVMDDDALRDVVDDVLRHLAAGLQSRSPHSLVGGGL